MSEQDRIAEAKRAVLGGGTHIGRKKGRQTTKYVVVPYVRVPPEQIDDLQEFDTEHEAEKEMESMFFQQPDTLFRVEEIESWED